MRHFICLCLFYPILLGVSQISHDHCEQAKEVRIGELLPQENNQEKWFIVALDMCLLTFVHISGITGTVSIDENGDRNADYSLLDMNPKTHKFEVHFAVLFIKPLFICIWRDFTYLF